ncbi:puttaive FtsX-family transport protein [Streptococcus pneumoniae]|nr:puttaive FtsX-family transport protein [Streptococcus pneumoniae]
MNMSNITIDGQEMDLSQTMPSYAQVVSLYDDTSISVNPTTIHYALKAMGYTRKKEPHLL